MAQTTELHDSVVVPFSVKSCLNCKHCDCVAAPDKKCRRLELQIPGKYPWIPQFPLCRDSRAEDGPCGIDAQHHEPYVPWNCRPRIKPIFPLPALPPPDNNSPFTRRAPHVEPIKWRQREEDTRPFDPPAWNNSYEMTTAEIIISAVIVGIIVFTIAWCIIHGSPHY